MNSKGYSLLEFAMVTATLGIAGSMAVPDFKVRSQIARTQAEVKKIEDVLLKARSQARFSLNCVSVEVQSHAIVLSQYRVCGPPLADLISTETIPIENGVTLAPFTTGNPLTFLQSGGTDAATASVLAVTTANVGNFNYVVMPAIGAVRKQ